ncbi:MAG TPA: gamma-glutamylcyclotransferase family protein [Acidimicrobiales bacterium]|nr:gamma-glutamylcyclotransferase family protein [Acidimicrobiales bacterium]
MTGAVRARHPPDLFVYGTLQFAPVLDALLGRVPRLEPAVLADHEVVGLPDRSYPGLVRSDGGAAEGFVCPGLASPEWDVIDAFEDGWYELVVVTAHSGGEQVVCGAYRLPPGQTGDGGWSADEFCATELTRFTAACADFRASLGHEVTRFGGVRPARTSEAP